MIGVYCHEIIRFEKAFVATSAMLNILVGSSKKKEKVCSEEETRLILSSFPIGTVNCTLLL